MEETARRAWAALALLGDAAFKLFDEGHGPCQPHAAARRHDDIHGNPDSTLPLPCGWTAPDCCAALHADRGACNATLACKLRPRPRSPTQTAMPARSVRVATRKRAPGAVSLRFRAPFPPALGLLVRLRRGRRNQSLAPCLCLAVAPCIGSRRRRHHHLHQRRGAELLEARFHGTRDSKPWPAVGQGHHRKGAAGSC